MRLDQGARVACDNAPNTTGFEYAVDTDRAARATGKRLQPIPG